MLHILIEQRNRIPHSEITGHNTCVSHKIFCLISLNAGSLLFKCLVYSLELLSPVRRFVSLGSFTNMIFFSSVLCSLCCFVFMYWKWLCMWRKCVWLWISCTEREGGSEGNGTPWFVKEEGIVGGGSQGGATNPLAPSSAGGGRLAEGWVAPIGPPSLRCWLFTHAPTFPSSLFLSVFFLSPSLGV